ncbi:hypothetical protein EG856_01825 [Mycoplasmopsis phocirhinis]|uniref:Lipoprotein n=1 Tax=Mycoplasmopsis phocirhinis TaxID=142650 RepID=A0A4P6MM04_9BACT|nr:hypothetical protein [Mycoplasmopsis phocirhinis]QBF34655.1 hypothetical protein EG856_01825 [Mycoplasmopsis phocirhinis]
MKFKKSLTLSSLLSLTPAVFLSASCDNRDANKNFVAYKNAFEQAQQLYNEVRDIEYVSDSNLAKFSIIDKYLNLDLWNYLQALQNQNYQDNEINNLGLKVNKNIELINNILNDNDTADIENIQSRVLKKSADLEKLIDSFRLEQFPLFFAFEHLYKHHQQRLDHATQAKSSSILKIIENHFDNLLNFISDEQIQLKLNSIYNSKQKYSLLNQEFNLLSEKLDQKSQINQYINGVYVDNWNQLKTDAAKFNDQVFLANQKYKIIDFNFIFAYYLDYIFNSNSHLSPSNNQIDVDKIKQSLQLSYKINYFYYQNVLTRYHKFTSCLWKIGPKGPQFLKKYSFLGRLNDYTKNINKSNKIFAQWNLKLNNNQAITYTDDFRVDLPYYLRLYDDQIIWTNAHQSLTNSRAYQQNFGNQDC